MSETRKNKPNTSTAIESALEAISTAYAAVYSIPFETAADKQAITRLADGLEYLNDELKAAK